MIAWAKPSISRTEGPLRTFLTIVSQSSVKACLCVPDSGIHIILYVFSTTESFHIERVLQIGKNLLQDFCFAESVDPYPVAPGIAQIQIPCDEIEAGSNGEKLSCRCMLSSIFSDSLFIMGLSSILFS